MSKKIYKKYNSVPVKPESKKPTASFWFVLFAILFLVCGSVLGTIAFFRTSASDTSSFVALSDESSLDSETSSLDVVEFPNIIDLTGVEVSASNYSISCPSSSFFSARIQSGDVWKMLFSFDAVKNQKYYLYLSDFNGAVGVSFVVYLNNKYLTGTNASGFLPIVCSESGTVSLSFSFNSNKFTGSYPFEVSSSMGLYNISNVSEDLVFNSLIYSVGKLDGYNGGYDSGYSNGYSSGYNSGLNDNSTSKGFFEGGSFSFFASSELDLNNVPFDSFKLLDSDYYRGYYSGVYFCDSNNSSLVGNDLFSAFDSSRVDSFNASYISCFFGLGGKDFPSSSVFNVLRRSSNGFFSVGEFGSGCVFYFTDGSSVSFNTADDYFSTIDLSKFLGKRVLRVLFFTASGDVPFFGLMNNSAYSSAYNFGFSDGKKEGYNDGFSIGRTFGYGQGYNVGVESANNYSFLGLFGAVIDAPIKAVSGLLNFNLLGFNMASFFYAILTLALIITIIRLVV